ncbi:site-specific integrase [Pseudomonas sp. CNPSo 3701]|uniref:site-specific integrase n=1 Tax=Pseudomonas sp. CNPSo 3701 TaxID=3027943 RepID=UPI002363994E|nr:site-specific integrase [Pseudomonas sp. CNPSo 3701]MDD1507730.1 site-specific integrase [Pseudomonas sp. CNPSo 3701]
MAYVVQVKTSYRSDRTGVRQKLPGTLTQDGLLISHLRYLSIRGRSESWKEKSAFAVRKLIEYMNANEGYFDSTEDLLRGCVRALMYGTIDADTLSDPSGLYWSPRSEEDYLGILAHLTSYTDWLAEQPEYNTRRANPFRKATHTEERLNWCAYFNKESHVFLSHLSDRAQAVENAKTVRSIKFSRQLNSLRRPTKRFPESEIDNLMVNGWVRKPKSSDPAKITHLCATYENVHIEDGADLREKTFQNATSVKSNAQLVNAGSQTFTEHDFIDYKGRAITLLLHYGGVRKSEVFQLYLQDFVMDWKRGELIVRIYHPSLGKSPDDRYKNRREYLLHEFGMVPRTEVPRSQAMHAGWKAPLLNESGDNYLTVQFCPIGKAKEFMATFYLYLEHQRVEPPKGGNHPYAFTNSSGNPETLKNFRELHRAAVNRIGLPHNKMLGTSEHGHRHAYGYRLGKLPGITRLEIKNAMHHRNIESSAVYLEPTEDDVREKMEECERKAGRKWW